MTDTQPHSPLDALLGASPRRAMRHWLSLLLLTIAAVGMLVFFVRFITGDDSPYYSAVIERGDIVPLVSERGIVRGSGEVAVYSQIAGKTLWVVGKQDSTVEKGELLARLDPGDIDRTVAVDRAEVDAARAQVESARIAARDAADRLARFDAVWRRSQGRVPSLNEMEAARAQAVRANLDVEAAAAKRDAAALRLKAAKAKASGKLVRAPISGVLVMRHTQPGQAVTAGQPLFTIAAGTRPLTIEVPLPPHPNGPMQAGARARVRLDAMPDKVQSATLTRLRIPPPPQTAPERAVFTIETPAPEVRPGLPATVEMNLAARTNVLLVPDASLTFEPSEARGTAQTRKRIYLLTRDGEPKRVYVTVGGSDGKRTEVFATGIRPGDQVITGWRNAASAP